MSIFSKQFFFTHKWAPLLAIVLIFFSFIYFNFYHYFTFENLRQHRDLLLAWKDQHYVLAVSTYIFVYTLSVASSFPGTILFTLSGGLLFGLFPGTLYVVVSDTIGSIILFIAIKMAFSDWFTKKTGKWLKKMEQGFKADAFNYLLMLRLIPIFPFCLVNIIPGLLGIRITTFAAATLLGIIPSALIYTSVGHSLGTLFDHDQMPDLNVIFQLHFLLPLFALATLAILPIVYKRFTASKESI